MSVQGSVYNPDLDEHKLVNAILYFVTDPEIRDLGKTKLMKLLYFADFDHFEQYDQPITGARYIRLDHGPVPDDARNTMRNMLQSGDLTESKVAVGGYDRFAYAASREFNPSVFTPEELETLRSDSRCSPRSTSRWRRMGKHPG